MFTAYLIDPTTRTVTAVEYTDHYEEINRLICAEVFTAVSVPQDDEQPYNGDTVYVDDEGLINNNPHGWFLLNGYPQPLRGKGLVLGTDSEGRSASPRVTLAALTARVSFPTEPQALMMLRH